MSGEQWLKRFGLFALILFCIIFVIATMVSADESEKKDDNPTYLLDLANSCQDSNGSWGDDINNTVKITWANSEVLRRDGNFSEDIEPYIVIFDRGANWTSKNYHENISVETQSIIYMSPDYFIYNITRIGYGDLQFKVGDDILDSQQPNGSWNNDVGDTAMASFSFHINNPGNKDSIQNGIEWLEGQENKQENSWGSVEADSKSILALDSAGIDVDKEISALKSKQRSDGSFGGIEDTAWATIALSKYSNKEAADKAMAWLRSQKYENNNDLAIAVFAEQYYENAKFEEDKGKGIGGFIPPPFLFMLFLILFGSLILSYWLFARIDREEILDGVRKDIYIYITKNPGEYLANITKALKLSSGSVRYHLSVLEGMDKIVTHKNGKYRRYYINKNGYSQYTNGNGYKHIMSALKNNTARKIVKFLISHPGSNQKSVSNALKVYPSTVNWHIKRLKDAEIIEKHKKGKEIVYFLNQDVQLKKVIGIIEGSVA